MIGVFDIVTRQLRSAGYIVWLSAGISVVFIVGLLFLSEPEKIALLLRGTGPIAFVSLVLLTLVIYIVIAGRTLVILRLNILEYARPAIHVTALHAFFLQFLPMRIGDFLYPPLLKNYLGASWSESTANYFVSRLYDLITTVILLAIAIAMLHEKPDEAVRLREVSSWVIVLVVLIGLLAAICQQLYRRLPENKSVPDRSAPKSIGTRVRFFLLENLVHIRSLSLTGHVIIIGLTIVRWLITAGVFMILLKEFGVDFGYLHYLLIAMGANLSGIIPLQSIGGIGVVDSVLAAMLVLLGVPQADAISAALAYRVVWILNIGIITGLLLSYNEIYRRYLSTGAGG